MNSGTESVEVIRLYYDNMEESETVQVEAFKKMSNLRFIQLIDPDSYLQWSSTSSSSSNDDMSSFSFKKLKYLDWRVLAILIWSVIKLRHSKLEILWEGFKSLKKLRILDVSYSTYLTKTGNFTGLEKLEELYLNYCVNLEEVHSSIGFNNCISNTLYEVGSLPDSLSHLHELKRIELSGCTNLMSIPNLPQNIVTVQAFNCKSLVNLPSNMSELQSLTELNLDGCLKLEPEGFMKVTGLRNLHRLSMRNCNVSQVSSEIGNLVSLEFLNLSKNSFSNLPDSFSNLSKLVELKMNFCYQLQLLPLLPLNLQRIKAYNCRSLDVMRYDSIQTAYFFRSKKLEESFFTEPLEIILSGDEVPEWCNFRSNGSVLSFVAPMHHLDNKIRGVILCATFIKEWNPSGKPKILPVMLNKTKNTCHHFHVCYVLSTE